MQYPVAIYHKEDGYHVMVPDIPSLTTTGHDMAEAVSNARTVVINHLFQLLEEDSPIPQPSPVSQHLTNPDYAGFTWAIVGIEMSRIMGESMELTVHLPTRLFKQITKQYRDEPLDSVIVKALKLLLDEHNVAV